MDNEEQDFLFYILNTALFKYCGVCETGANNFL